MIAGATGLDAPGPPNQRQSCRRSSPTSGVPNSGAVLTGSNANSLIPGIDQRQHVGERRARLHGDDQFVRLICRHRIQSRQVEQRIGRHRLADQPLGAMADDFQRLFAGKRGAHNLLDIRRVTYFQCVHDCPVFGLCRPRRGGVRERGKPQRQRSWLPPSPPLPTRGREHAVLDYTNRPVYHPLKTWECRETQACRGGHGRGQARRSDAGSETPCPG